MIVLVCGGRAFADYFEVSRALAELHERTRITCIIHGGATGADACAERWARANAIRTRVFPVTREAWRTYGKAAGPMRNTVMLRDGAPQIVVAFPGGRGTADMVGQAKAAGVPVVRVEAENDRTARGAGEGR